MWDIRALTAAARTCATTRWWDSMDCQKFMKTAYELAMERLSKTAPTVRLTDAQKAQLAELDATYAAKIAEREIFVKGEIAKALDRGDDEAIEQLEKQLVSDRKSLQAEREERKTKVREPGNAGGN